MILIQVNRRQRDSKRAAAASYHAGFQGFLRHMYLQCGGAAATRAVVDAALCARSPVFNKLFFLGLLARRSDSRGDREPPAKAMRG